MADELRIIDRSPEFIEKLKKAARKCLKEAGEAAVERAKVLVPKDTELLEEAIRSRIKNLDDGYLLQVGADRKRGGWYGKFSEFGTKKEPRKEFMRPACEHMDEEFAVLLKEAAKKIELKEAKAKKI